jgi:hypothetical protein
MIPKLFSSVPEHSESYRVIMDLGVLWEEASRMFRGSSSLVLLRCVDWNHALCNCVNVCSEPGRSREGGGRVSHEGIEIL